MSRPSPTRTDQSSGGSAASADADDARSADHSGRRSLPAASLPSSVRSLGFWLAVVLPFLHIPLLFSGLDDVGETFAFLGLLALNAFALLVGRSHRRDEPQE